MALYNVAVMEQSLTRKTVKSDSVAYRRCVRASTSREAIAKCISDIIALPFDDDGIKFISVLCGRKGSVTGAASRLTPIQITRDGKFR